jgi:hypothetical protein
MPSLLNLNHTISHLKSIWRQSTELALAYNCSPITLIFKATFLRIRYQIYFKDAIYHELLNPKKSFMRARSFIDTNKVCTTLKFINFPSDNVDDKANFHKICRANNIPTPKLIALSDENGVWGEDNAVIASGEGLAKAINDTPANDFVLKPTRQYSGKGILFLSKKNNQTLTCQLGINHTISELYELINTKAYILQLSIDNHPIINKLSCSPALQTIRIVTFNRKNSTPFIFAALLKISNSELLIDNYEYGENGNLVAMINIDTGVISHGVGKHLGDTYHVHPATQMPITGLQLPLWDQCLKLAIAAAEMSLPVKAIGWDIALTPTGPVMIEGNTVWSPTGRQGAYFTPADYKFLCHYFDVKLGNT